MLIIVPSTKNVSCNSEYGMLKKVILCPPSYMKITDVINETQKQYFHENIDREKAMNQHKQFAQVLKENNIEVVQLPARERFPEQVFTRDIGFTIGQTTFVSKMGTEVRRGEEKILNNWLRQHNLSLKEMKSERIEGGDVIVDRSNIFVGVSERTTLSSITNLQTLLPEFNVIPMPFKKKYLHLDCVFNVVSPTEALVYSPAFNEKELKILSAKYDLIEVNEEEQFTLGTNMLSLGDKKICSLPINKKINKQLRKRGYKVIEIDLSEIIKSGGSFRCCSMPLVREDV
jgi:N-dimethylarginine dimethylaminohydrolase